MTASSIHSAALAFSAAFPFKLQGFGMPGRDSNLYLSFPGASNHWNAPTAAVRTGVEPVATDRQSVMLAVTPTNLVTCAGIEPASSH